MSERLSDEELAAIEGQCDGFSMLILNPAAQRDVMAMSSASIPIGIKRYEHQ